MRAGDHMIRAVAWGGRVRVLACDSTRLVNRLRAIHDASPVTAAALGRLATGALLMAATLEKVTGREPLLTIEVNGGGPAGKLLATASPRGWVRAMAANPLAVAPRRSDGKLNVAGVVGSNGELVVTRDPGVGEPYRGAVSLVTGEIARDLAHYLHDSEQVPSAVLLGVRMSPEVGVGHAGGLLLQILPGVSHRKAELLIERIEGFGVLTSRMASGEDPTGWLAELFPEGAIMFDRTPLFFSCGCSIERVETAIKLLGADEISEMIGSGDGSPTVLSCGFCRTDYQVSRHTLETLLREVRAEGAAAACD